VQNILCFFLLYFVLKKKCIEFFINYFYGNFTLSYNLYIIYNILLLCRMENTQKYIIVQSLDDKNNINAIPQI